MTMNAERRGFTLVELIVVILLIGILVAFGVPQYMRAMENNKAEDAASMTNMIGTANRMYALYHSGNLASGTLSSSCSGNCAQDYTACDLVRCKYVAAMDFDKYAYAISVGGSCGGGVAACAARRTSGSNSTTTSPYSTWGYSVTTTGQMNMIPCSGSSSCPPTPTQ